MTMGGYPGMVELQRKSDDDNVTVVATQVMGGGNHNGVEPKEKLCSYKAADQSNKYCFQYRVRITRSAVRLAMLYSSKS
jgi:hypothetical protein